MYRAEVYSDCTNTILMYSRIYHCTDSCDVLTSDIMIFVPYVMDFRISFCNTEFSKQLFTVLNLNIVLDVEIT